MPYDVGSRPTQNSPLLRRLLDRGWPRRARDPRYGRSSPVDSDREQDGQTRHVRAKLLDAQ